MASSSTGGELGTLGSESKQKKIKSRSVKKKKAEVAQSKSSSDNAEVCASRNEIIEDQQLSLLEHDDSDRFTNVCQEAPPSQEEEGCRDARCFNERLNAENSENHSSWCSWFYNCLPARIRTRCFKERLNAEKSENHSSRCSWFYNCLPAWITKPDLYYKKPADLEDMGTLMVIPKARLFRIWEIFSSIDTDTDMQVDAAEVKIFFYHLGAASEDASCRAKIATQLSHPDRPDSHGFTAQDQSSPGSSSRRSSGSSSSSGISMMEARGLEAEGSVQRALDVKDIYDASCRANIATRVSHPDRPDSQAFTAQDFLDVLAQEPMDTLKASGWVRSFGTVLQLQADMTEARGSEAEGSVQPASDVKDIYDEPDMRPVTWGFWQFARLPLCQPPADDSDPLSVDLVEEFRRVALQKRWGRFHSWKLATAFERFRQYNERSRMERILGLNLSRPDLITIALNLFAAFSSVLDVYTDVELLVAIFNKSRDCLDLSLESDACIHHSYMKLGILLALSIAAPFVISYGHIIANLQENGFFANGRNACFGFLLAGWFGPIYLAILELPLLCRDVVWAPMTCLVGKGARDKGEMVWARIFQSLGIVDGGGYRKQRAMAQLFFETIPQLLLQFMVVEGVIQAQDLVESDRETIIRSLVLAVLNLLCQLFRTWFECRVVEEPFLRYTIINLLACSDWVPFLDLFFKTTPPAAGSTRPTKRHTINYSELSGRLPGNRWTGLRLPISFRFTCTSVQHLISELCRQTAEDGNSAPWRRLRDQKYDEDSRKFRLQKLIAANHAKLLGQPYLLSLAEEMECHLLQVDNGSYRYYKRQAPSGASVQSDDVQSEEFLKYHRGIETFFANTSARLGRFGDGGSTANNFKFVLGSSCERLCLQEILQLILACWSRVSVDFSGVDWSLAVERSHSSGLLAYTYDEGEGQWQASMPDGDPVLAKCLMLGLSQQLADPQQAKFDLRKLAEDLLALKANPNVRDTSGQSLLLSCVKQKKARAVQLLVKHDVEISTEALQEAVQSSTANVLLQLLDSEKMSQPSLWTLPDGKHKSLCGLACCRLTGACMTIEQAACGDPAFEIGAIFEALEILRLLHEKGLTLPVAEIGYVVESKAALCICQFHEGNHPQLKTAVHKALQQSIVETSSKLLDRVTEEGDTMFHLLARRAPLRAAARDRMTLWLQKYPEVDCLQYLRFRNKAGLSALEVALDVGIGRDPGNDLDGKGMLSWLFEKTEIREDDFGKLLQRCVETCCTRAKSYSMSKDHISDGIRCLLLLANRKALYPEFSQSCFDKAADMLVKESHYKACQILIKAAGEIKLSTQSVQHMLLNAMEGAKKKVSRQVAETKIQHSAHKVEEVNSAQVIGKRQSVLGICGSQRHLRELLDAKLQESQERPRGTAFMNVIVKGLVIVLEVLSAADLVTDILLLRWMYLSHHIWWATLSCLMMVAPYLAAFSATLRIGLRNRIFEGTDCDGKAQAFYWCRKLAGAVCMTPLCVAAFILLDFVYTVKAATFDVFALVLGLIAPGWKLDLTDGAVSKFLSDHLGLTTMDVEGYRRLRTTTQLLFESFPQIVLQLYILLKSSSEREFEVSDQELVISLAFALFHLFATCCIVGLEARSARESVAHYTMTCLTGRLGWLPLANTANDEGASGRKMHFDDLSFSFACGRFTMTFEFSQSTWAKLLGALSKVQDKAGSISVAFGPSISLLNVNDILTFHKRFSKVQLSMQSGTEPVPWTRILQNSGLSLPCDNVSMLQKQQPSAQKLLEDFILNHNHDAVQALLEAGVCNATGLTSRGLMYLTFAVEMRDAKICKLLLTFKAPLTSAELSAEIEDPLIEVGYRVRSTLETPLEAAFRVMDADVMSTFLFHERIQANLSMRKRVLKLTEAAREANLLAAAQTYAHASGLAPDWGTGAISRKARVLLPGEARVECCVAELELFELFREKLFPVEDDEMIHQALKNVLSTTADDVLEVDLTFLALPQSVFSAAHLEQLLAVIRADAPLPPAATLSVLDGLVEELGFVNMQKYMQITAPHRVTRAIQQSQSERQRASHSDSREKRALVLCSATLPSDCWRVYSMRISGRWTDQGWGNTNINKVEIRAVTARAGLVYVQLHSVDWKSDKSRTEVSFGGTQLGQGLDEEDEQVRKNLDLEGAESLLEILTEGDLVQITMGCVGWSGHRAQAEDTRLEIEYFPYAV